MKKNEKSINLRTDPLFLRDSYPTAGAYRFPLISKAPSAEIRKLISFRQIKSYKDVAYREKMAIHFFKDDKRFEKYYAKPNDEDIFNLAQYPYVFTPDFSLYPEMDIWRQIEQVAKSRWCGAHWQARGLRVIPTISWSNEESFAFCFDSIEVGSAVAISTLGDYKSRKEFMSGYNRMLEVIKPVTIYCYGETFEEMEGNIIKFSYEAFLKEGA